MGAGAVRPSTERDREFGRGRGRGGRSWAERNLERLDCVETRGSLSSKQGTNGTEVALFTNYFQVSTKGDGTLLNYRVDFTPEEERSSVKKRLMRVHEGTLGKYIFDGTNLYMSNRISGDVSYLISVIMFCSVLLCKTEIHGL